MARTFFYTIEQDKGSFYLYDGEGGGYFPQDFATEQVLLQNNPSLHIKEIAEQGDVAEFESYELATDFANANGISIAHYTTLEFDSEFGKVFNVLNSEEQSEHIFAESSEASLQDAEQIARKTKPSRIWDHESWMACEAFHDNQIYNKA